MTTEWFNRANLCSEELENKIVVIVKIVKTADDEQA